MARHFCQFNVLYFNRKELFCHMEQSLVRWISPYCQPGSDKYYLFSFPFYLIFQNLSVVNFIILLHLLIAYFGFFKLGSLLTKNYNALLIFSLFFAFSGILLGRIYAGHHLLLYGLAWIPLLYYFFFKIVLLINQILSMCFF